MSRGKSYRGRIAILTLDKERVQIFSLAYFAHEIGRTVNLLYRWEVNGISPGPALPRSPEGERWYLQEEIDLYERLIKMYGVRQGMKIPAAFVAEIKAGVSAIRETWTKKLKGRNAHELVCR